MSKELIIIYHGYIAFTNKVNIEWRTRQNSKVLDNLYSLYIHLCFQLSRSVQIGDFHLYIQSLAKIVFFSMLDKYLKIDETHAEISKEFTKDRFGVKKNEEKSSREVDRE